MPRGRNAPKLCPAVPRRVRSIVFSGSPAPRVALVTWWPRIVPTVRSTLRTVRSARTSSPLVSAGSAICEQLDVELVVEPVVLGGDRVQRRAFGELDPVQDRAQVEPLRLPVLDRACGYAAPRRVRRPPRACGSRAGPGSSRTSWATNSKKLTTKSAWPSYLARSSGFWVATPTGQVSRWQTRIITQPETTSGAVAKPNSSAPSRAATTHVTAGLQLAVGLHHDPVTQAVEQQGLLGLGQAELPRAAGVLERGQRCRAGAAVVAGDQHHVGLGLRDAGRDRADADLGDQLHVHPCARVGALQVVDQLLEVLDRVDVVVRRRRDQADARAWSAGSWRPTGTPSGRAAGRPRRAWRPAPS